MPALIISFLKNAKYPTVPKNTWNVNRNAHHHCPFWQGAYIHNLRERWLKRIWLLLDPKRDLWSVFSTNVLMFVRQLQWRLARAKRDEWHLPERLVFAENWSSDGGWCGLVPSKKTSLLESRGWVVVLWLPTEFSRWTWELDSSRDPGAAGNLELKFK